MNSKERKEKALKEAREAFFNSIAKSFPEAKTGDLSPLSENEFNEVTEKVFYEWVHTNERLFSGIYPTGIVYADRYKEVHGDYKKCAYLNYRTLILEIEKDCPDELKPLIIADAKNIQNKKGEKFIVSGSGQYITLGE